MKKTSLPKKAKRVFKGKIFDVWQWRQKMFDGSVETFEKLKRPDTVQVIATVKNKIIVLRQKQPDTSFFLSLPGGRVEKGEIILSAAKREFLEETGYQSGKWKLFRSISPYSKIDWKIYTFIAKNCIKARKPILDAGEIIKIKLYSFDDFIMLSENESFYDLQLKLYLLSLRLNRKKKQDFYNLLFGRKHS